ncbi:hypothetical protein FKM82_028223 [Ascaphus truei]
MSLTSVRRGRLAQRRHCPASLSLPPASDRARWLACMGMESRKFQQASLSVSAAPNSPPLYGPSLSLRNYILIYQMLPAAKLGNAGKSQIGERQPLVMGDL